MSDAVPIRVRVRLLVDCDGARYEAACEAPSADGGVTTFYSTQDCPDEAIAQATATAIKVLGLFNGKVPVI